MISKQRAVYEHKVSKTLDLLAKKGFDTRFMDGTYKVIGASMKERRGTVEGWLRSMRSMELSTLMQRIRAL